jgi:hypothetical protein
MASMRIFTKGSTAAAAMMADRAWSNRKEYVTYINSALSP